MQGLFPLGCHLPVFSLQQVRCSVCDLQAPDVWDAAAQGHPRHPPFWDVVTLLTTCGDVVTLLTTCGAAPATHLSGMWSPCSPPAGQKQSHTWGRTRSGPPSPGHTWGWPCPHSFPAQVSGQVSLLTSLTWCHSLPPRTHLGPVISPGEEPACQDFPQLYVFKKKTKYFLPFKFCKCTSKYDCSSHLYVCPGSWNARQADSPWKGVHVWGGRARSPRWDLLALCVWWHQEVTVASHLPAQF